MRYLVHRTVESAALSTKVEIGLRKLGCLCLQCWIRADSHALQCKLPFMTDKHSMLQHQPEGNESYRSGQDTALGSPGSAMGLRKQLRQRLLLPEACPARQTVGSLQLAFGLEYQNQ